MKPGGLAYEIGDLVRIESKILSFDLYKSSANTPSVMTGLIIDIDACVVRGDTGFEPRGYIVSVLVDEGLGLWDFGTKYWKIWKLYK